MQSLKALSCIVFFGAASLTPAAFAQQVEGKTPVVGQPEVQDKYIFGVLPNYRTADGTLKFAPITAKQKLTIAAKDSFNYPGFALAGAFSLLSQVEDSNPEFGQGLKGFAKRYSASLADQLIGNVMTEGLMPTLLHEDPRYFRKVHGSVKGRILYSATRVLRTRTDAAGNWRFNYSEVLGNGITASIGNAYYPGERGAKNTFERMGILIGTDAVSNVMKEFWPDIKQHWLHHKEDR